MTTLTDTKTTKQTDPKTVSDNAQTTDPKLLQEKLVFWTKKRESLQTQYDETMVLRAEAMAMGDLRENAAFQMADEDASTYAVRLEEVDRILDSIKKELGIE